MLLLLDYWPLKRLAPPPNVKKTAPQSKSPRKIPHGLLTDRRKSTLGLVILEKIPLLALAAISCAITYVVQQETGAVKPWDTFPPGTRMANASLSYVAYLVKMVYPNRLAILYPYPVDNLPPWQPIACFLMLALITAGVIYSARRHRYLLVGWLWYLGTLVPVIGLVQVGVQAMADRYTYLPSIGIFILAAWAAAEFSRQIPSRRVILTIMAGICLIGLSRAAR